MGKKWWGQDLKDRQVHTIYIYILSSLLYVPFLNGKKMMGTYLNQWNQWWNHWDIHQLGAPMSSEESPLCITRKETRGMGWNSGPQHLDVWILDTETNKIYLLSNIHSKPFESVWYTFRSYDHAASAVQTSLWHLPSLSIHQTDRPETTSDGDEAGCLQQTKRM